MRCAIQQFVSLSPPNKRSLCQGHFDGRSVVDGNILNSKGIHVGVVTGDAVFGLQGQKLYDLKGSNIYKLNGDLVGHLSDARGAEKRLDKATDKLFPAC
jgi:sporulation protein YlmC with PRC-barrel domain